MEKTRLELYQPSVSTYELYVPEGYTLDDDKESGILSITIPDGSSSLTISSYNVEGEVDEHFVDQFFDNLTSDYQPLSDRITLDKEDILKEQSFVKQSDIWTWWVLAFRQRIIVASVNSEDELSEELLGLYRFVVLHIDPFDESDT